MDKHISQRDRKNWIMLMAPKYAVHFLCIAQVLFSQHIQSKTVLTSFTERNSMPFVIVSYSLLFNTLYFDKF